MRPVLRIPRPAWEAWAVVGAGWDPAILEWTGTRVLDPRDEADRLQALHELQLRVLDVDVPGGLVWADSPIVDNTPDRRIWRARLPGEVVAAGPAHIRYGAQLPREAEGHVLQAEIWRATARSLRAAIEAQLGVTLPPRRALRALRGARRRLQDDHPDALRILRRLRRALADEEPLPEILGRVLHRRYPMRRVDSDHVVEADDLAPPLWAGETDVMSHRAGGSIS